MLARLLLTYIRPYRKQLALVVFLQLVATIAALYLPSLNADIVDQGIVNNDQGYIWGHGGIMLAVSFVQIVFSIAGVYFGAKAAMGFGRDVRHALFHQVTGYSAKEVNELGAPSLITRITNDVTQVQMLVLTGCTMFVGAPIMTVGGVIMALREDVGLSAILLFSIPMLVTLVGLVVRRMIPTFRLMQERIDEVNRVLREQITGIRVVRAFVREPAERARFGAANEDLTETALTAGRLVAAMFPSIMIVLNVSTVATIWVGADRIDAGAMQVGQMIAFISYLAQILMSLMMATFMAIMIPRAAVCAERLMEVLDTSSSVVESPDALTDLPARVGVELRDVGFHYPGADEPVLVEISLTVAPGTTTAVIGSTGSGKSTLLNLIPRLFDVTSGQVLVGDVDVRDIALETLWSRIGIVPQKPYLFSGTVASNLRYSKPDATDDELWEALTVAQAADFVRAMPEQLDAPIVQGGSNVSGGQRQRLAIARALVRRPSVYLFDDSFSALDLATDARLRAALTPHIADSAVIIVAQRVSTIMGADQILVVEDGHAVGLGSHHELLTSCPTYREIVESQMSMDEAA
ncbi:MAG: ABC transporter ATP-binding protein/permease [Microthrixaceae bacterium]|nr:ABC transporter ATP-binding protein/permease [Microthrixaceae bacterium]